MSQTSEKAFENYIQEAMAAGGWSVGDKTLWDKEAAIFPEYVLGFIKKTQPQLWTQMEQLHGAELPGLLIKALLKERINKGTMHIIRHEFKFYGKAFKLAYFKPAHGMNPEALALYDQNQFHVTRQIPCHPDDNSTIDMLLSLNGIPLMTLELKNPATGQTWRDAVNQYQTDRNPHAPLFLFQKGAVVHFAVDPEEVYMTTKLNGTKTFFLPFNRGSNPGDIDCGAGNPPNPDGYRTAYLWEEVLHRDSFMDLISHFIFLETKKEIQYDDAGIRREVTKETMIFPRYHQLLCIRDLTRLAAQEGAGHNYLIQHSAGSGKTNSISWLSHRLASLHNHEDQKIFDCVIVISDRRVLDKQLQDAIYQIEHTAGVVVPVDENTGQLASALIDGTQIVITTLQKFPFVLQSLLRIAGAENVDAPSTEALGKARNFSNTISKRRYAVIVDEAHSSQSGESARELKQILGAAPVEEDEDWQDNLCRIMESRKQQQNVSFFAFTATPKGKTLEIFGRKNASGKPEPVCFYSMKQAIEEHFILDVLQNYVTYKTYFGLVKKIEDDPPMPKKKATKKLGKFLNIMPYNIEQKIEIIIEHFRAHIKPLLGGRAKAMVVTSSRLQAVRYMKAFQRYIAENHYTDVRPLVAFSGKVQDDGIVYTEPGMNIDLVTGKSISETQLPDKFNTPDYQVLLVANKYQTGFDQPLLCAMYVDKHLDGVQAVQTLSRLNRISPGKESVFVMDFANEAENILKAFSPFYRVTQLDEVSDPTHLELLKHELNATQIYLWSEVENFCRIFYKPRAKQSSNDHAQMEHFVQPATDRFKNADKELQEEFYSKLGAYISLYSFLSQIMPYSDEELEMLYAYARYLKTHIYPDTGIVDPHPEKGVELEYYRLSKTMEGCINLAGSETVPVKSPTAVGTGSQEDEEKPLSEIIKVLNEKLGTDFTDEDRLFFEQIQEKAIHDERIIQIQKANPLDRFALGIKEIIESLMIQRMSENDAIVSRYMDDKDFQKTIFPILAKNIFNNIQTMNSERNNMS